jgi:precorrin-6B methylase 2
VAKSIEGVAEAALHAMDAGQAVFACTVQTDDLANAIEATESIGWKLEYFSTSLSPGIARMLLATCIFRRR